MGARWWRMKCAVGEFNEVQREVHWRMMFRPDFRCVMAAA